jgi:hypothetical protein
MANPGNPNAKFYVDPVVRVAFVAAAQAWIARLLKGERLRASAMTAGGVGARNKAARKLYYQGALKRFGAMKGPTVQYEAGNAVLLKELSDDFDNFYYGEWDAAQFKSKPVENGVNTDAVDRRVAIKEHVFKPITFTAVEEEDDVELDEAEQQAARDEPSGAREALEMMANRMMAFLAILERIDARLGRLEKEWGLPPLGETQ